MDAHPNTVAAVVTTAVGAGILHLAHRYGYARLTNEQALLVAGGAISGVLFVGRRGLKAILVEGVRGLLVGIWKGSAKPAPEPPVAPTTTE
jgi:hypothetical protein